MKTDEQKQSIEEMKNFKKQKLFTYAPSYQKATLPKDLKKVQPIFKATPPLPKTESLLDSMELLIKKIDQKIKTVDTKPIARKKIKIDLPQTEVCTQLKKAIQNQLADVVETGEDFFLTYQKEQTHFLNVEKTIFSINDLDELQKPFRKKELWNLLVKSLTSS
jgi:ATP-dependent exoDNAse (exonuclease V) alpha subunit